MKTRPFFGEERKREKNEGDSINTGDNFKKHLKMASNLDMAERFTFISSQQILASLDLSLNSLSTIRSHVQMGNLKFESLCHGVASSLQEISLRMVKMSSTDDNSELREQILQSRKSLLDCANVIVFNAQHPYKAFPYLESISSDSCVKALQVWESQQKRSVSVASVPALQALDILEKSSGYKSLFLNIKQFGNKLHHFLELAANLCQDLRNEGGRLEIVSRVEAIKKVLPFIIQSLRESLRHPMNSHTRSNREYFFRTVRNSIKEIVDIFQEPYPFEKQSKNKEFGLFIRTLDSLIDFCNERDKNIGLEDLDNLTSNLEWLVKFALSVSKATDKKDEAEIVTNCHDIVSEVTSLKAMIGEDKPERDIIVTKDILKDGIELLEQTVNNSLLKLIIDLFCNISSPLDRLIHAILNSSVSPPDRLPEDLDDLISAFDDRADLLFLVTHFTIFCTTDKARSQDINSSLHFMKHLEKELVPACLKLYFNPDDHGARSHLNCIRRLWNQELELLENNVFGITDATAFCYVVNLEVKKVAAIIKKEQYTQDKLWMHLNGYRLIRMCQKAVDFAWKEIQSNSNSRGGDEVLPDDHPIVKVERSTGEVREALRLVMNNIEDLNLHKTMIRRVQVLVTCLGIMSHFLIARSESVISISKVKVLTSVSRISIGPDSKLTVLTNGENRDGNSSRKKTMSFRSVQRKESILQRKVERTENKEVNETIARYMVEAEENISQIVKKKDRLNKSQRNGSALVSKSGYDFTEIFNELSALSHEISNCLEDKEENKFLEQIKSSTKKDVSLRQMAFKNAAAKQMPLQDLSNSSMKSMALGARIASPERLRDIKNLNAKLAAIRSDLEGTEAN